MVIDFHTHVFPPRIRENRSQYADNDPSFALLYSGEKAKLATAEELIASMDRDGVEISVIVNYGWTTHELCVATNDYIMESLARHPKRLIGFCAVQLQSLEAAITEIERCARGGIRGVGELRPDLQLTDFPDENALQPLVKVLQKHNLMLMIHASLILTRPLPPSFITLRYTIR